MSRNIIKLARGTKSSIGTKLTNGDLAEYEIVYATDTKEIGVVNMGLASITWSGALDYANIADNLRVATQNKKGAMSAQDKTNLDTLMDLLGSESEDADQIVNNIREVLDAFENFPEGTDLLTKFTELDNGKVDKLTTGPTAGTYTKVTVNTEGQVTEGDGLAASDIPSLPASKITSGTLGVDRGGTGKATFTSGEVLVGNGTSAVSTLPRSGIDSRASFPPSAHDHSGDTLKPNKVFSKYEVQVGNTIDDENSNLKITNQKISYGGKGLTLHAFDGNAPEQSDDAEITLKTGRSQEYIFNHNGFNMGSNKITNLGTPMTNTDAATKKYVDDSTTGFADEDHNHDDQYLKLAGGTVSSLIVEQELRTLELQLGGEYVFPKLTGTVGSHEGSGLLIRLKDDTANESTYIELTMSSLNMRGIPVSNTTIDGGNL